MGVKIPEACVRGKKRLYNYAWIRYAHQCPCNHSRRTAGYWMQAIFKRTLSGDHYESNWICRCLSGGAAGTLSKMLVFTEAGTGLTTTGSMIMILSLTFGALIGEIIDIDGLFERFGEWLKHRTGSDGDNQFTNGFVAASLTVSIGAMAIIGSIQDGIYGDYSTLTAKAVLDFIIVLIMASSMGKGCVFSFIPVAALQGSMTALAVLLSGFMTTPVLDNLSLVGNILIFCVGVNLVWPKTIKVANLLPSLVVAVVLTTVK